MKQLLWLLVGLLGGANATAQVDVRLRLEKKEYLPNEKMIVAVQIMNVSGQALQLGGDPDWIHFHIEKQSGESVPQIVSLPPAEPFEAPTGGAFTPELDLSPYFNLSTPGRYKLSATVRIRQWKEDRVAPPVNFEVIPPTTMKSIKVGVPPPAGAPPGPPEVRIYALQKARPSSDMRLYLRVTDGFGSRVFSVQEVGPYIPLEEPEVQVDSGSRLHVLHRSDRTAFIYSVFNPDGVLLVRQRHDINELTGMRPRLRGIQDGEVAVAGGVRILTPRDLPPEQPEKPASTEREKK
jgi:hypothetical protein